ncbi:MAG: ABC transporter ATP-binding protein [Rhodospirillaceae bacterium]|nr:ABC transporter ATP-binding protein [Rhodospirillaceae bacterium]
MDSSSPILAINDLEVGFDLPEGYITAVKNASFEIPRGTTVALVGESGSGKSVISQSILGLLPTKARISRGSINLDVEGKVMDIAKLDAQGKVMRNIRGQYISIIFQEPMTSLSPLHTIGDQITEALLLHRQTNLKEAREVTLEMLRLVGFPNPQRGLRTYPFELSGGLRQRAMIAMALICHPALLIADEPTTALDVTIQAQILKLMNDLQDQLNMAILMITHDLGVVANVADEVVVLYRGEVMESGLVEDIFRDPRHPYLKSLMAAVPRFGMGQKDRLIPIREVISESGHLLEENFSQDNSISSTNGKPLLKVENVKKEFSIRKNGLFTRTPELITAVNDVSFQIKRGSCLGLVGESGCGKTTLSKIIMRAILPDEGRITFVDQENGIDILDLTHSQLIDFRKKIQFIFQDPFSSLNPRMTIFDIISEPLHIHRIGDQKFRRDLVRELIKLVGLDIRHLNRFPHSFSGGQRQRIGIARALALRPQLLICDEPVSALDVSIQAQVLNLLKDLKEKLNLTYLFISHNLAVINYIADEIAVMCSGSLVEMASKEELFKNPLHPYTKALLAAVPNPDLDTPLDFNAIMDERCSKPNEWEFPFKIDKDNHPKLLHLKNGHKVRAHESILNSYSVS